MSDDDRWTTHPNVVAGITLIANLVLASILFSLSMGILIELFPIELDLGSDLYDEVTMVASFDEHAASWRGLVSLIVSGIGTAIIWNMMTEKYR